MTRLFYKFSLSTLLLTLLLFLVTSCVPQAVNITSTTSPYDPFPQTSVTPDSYTSSGYPSYCSYQANSNREECLGYSSSDSSNTTSNSNVTSDSSSSSSSLTNNYSSSYPSYCSLSQYSYRQDCGGNGIAPTASSYPSYCSDSTYSHLVACGGNGTQTSTASSYPSYCSNSANSHLTACGGNGVASTTTTIASTLPSYCSSSQYSYRTECGGNGVPNTVTSSSTYPAYCTTAANSTRPECTGTATTVSSSYPAYCSTPANSTRTECSGATSTATSTANITVTPINNTTTNTTNRPAYCATLANSTRPECAASTSTTGSNTNTTNTAVNISGVWQGNLVNTGNTLSVPICMQLSDSGGRVAGQIYFNRGSGLEYYGEIQGSSQSSASVSSNGTYIKNTNLIVYYPDRTRTQFTGNFDSNNSYTNEYTYFDANGATLTTGAGNLTRVNNSVCQ